ncbi:cadherin-like beta sandwich domain-containing protein [Brevifollis gellanilyticus]|uniref:Uncharacterized protein n=1 Tax=Brevifollis gellanilyticus TaxID=748831 RepID=A0A512M2J8_9BACT|nr:cadherin-like beta sandwich domain-containing protein [Brevifollis gellanilyticus]GEP40960.1 hypothetical protein BGE01nite_02510 [Brevifollis gellanilyticus]
MKTTHLPYALRTLRLSISLLLGLLMATSSHAQVPPFLLRESLLPPPGLQTGRYLGYGVAMDGALMAVAVPAFTTVVPGPGSVRVLNRSTGELLHVIPNPNPTANDAFGFCIALVGTRLVVGASGEASSAGAVYVYDLAGATPTVPALTINNPAPANLDNFGNAVALSSTHLVVGAFNDDTAATDAGSAYVFDLGSGTPAVPVLTLADPAAVASDQFGYAVAISGSRVVVGARLDDTGASSSGTTYVYDMTSGTPTVPVTTLNNPAPGSGDQFGFAVAILGDRVAVGAAGDSSAVNNGGNVFVYDLASGTPTVPVHTLTTPATSQGAFGSSLSLHGSRLLAGAYVNSVGAMAAGSAFLYDLSGGTPTVPVRAFHNPTPQVQDRFGHACVLSGDQILIGAPYDNTGAPDAGSAYLYDLTSATPTTPVSSINAPEVETDLRSGSAVAVSGSLVAVGTPRQRLAVDNVYSGCVKIYDRNSSTPTVPVFTLVNPLPANNGLFGTSISFSGSKLVIGTPGDFTGAPSAGIAYVYDLSSGTPTVPAFTLTNPNPTQGDNFGTTVAISGMRVVVGTPNEDVGQTNSGSAYVYDLAGGTPTVPMATLNNPDAGLSDLFGAAVAISGTRVVIGAHNDDTGGTDAGSVYVYDMTSGTPTVPVTTLSNPGSGSLASDHFGTSLAIEGARVVVSSPSDDTGATDAGCVYVYDVSGGTPSVPVLTLTHPSPASSHAFGTMIALSGNRLVVGTPNNDSGATDAGNVHIYDLSSGTPGTPIATLLNPTPVAADKFGTAVGLDGTTVAVGAPLAEAAGADQGAAYVYTPPKTNADLSALTLSSGGLTPGFDAATTSYTADIPAGTVSMTVTPTKADSGATIKVNDNAVASGSASGSITLQVGDNAINILVTAEDGVTTKSYTVTAHLPGSGMLAFASPVYIVASSAAGSAADIIISRSVSNAGAISCTLSSSDGSATAPALYTAQSGTAVPLADTVSEAHVMIPIAAGATTTTAKVFTISLANPSAGASLGAATTATVIILPPASATETTKPAVAITSPTNNATIVDTLPVIISGTATDNIGVAKVQVSVNNGVSFTDATLASIGGTSTTWTINVTPLNGPNAVKARALDFKGNVSAPATRSFTHLRTLTVGVSGPVNSGGVDAGFVPTSARQSGKSYSITAKAKAGHVFDGWTVNNMAGTCITPASAELPKLTFIMQPGLTLTAKFIINPFKPELTGDFSGLILASGTQPAGGTVMSHASTGLCTAKLTTTGALSGNVKLDGLTLPFTAQSDNTGVARFGPTRATTMTLVRPGKLPLLLALQADLTGATKTITGTLTEMYRGDITAEFKVTADRHAYNGKNASVPVSYVKSYTGRLKARASQGAGFTQHDYPAGDGFVSFKVQANGLVSMAGKLADDTPVTFSGNLSQANHWPVYQSLYSNKGCIAVDAVLDESQTDSDATAMNMLWFRPYQPAQWYPYGWSEGIFVDMLASKYTPPPASVFTGLGAVDATLGNTNLIFTGGLLSNGITKFVNLTPDDKTSNAPLSDKSFSLKLVPATGLISGDFTHTDGSKPKWQGVLLQKGANKGGHGYFMSSKPATLNYLGESGLVSWQAK